MQNDNSPHSQSDKIFIRKLEGYQKDMSQKNFVILFRSKHLNLLSEVSTWQKCAIIHLGVKQVVLWPYVP